MTLLMSALGQKQTLGKMRLMSALPPKADIVQHFPNVGQQMPQPRPGPVWSDEARAGERGAQRPARCSKVKFSFVAKVRGIDANTLGLVHMPQIVLAIATIRRR